MRFMDENQARELITRMGHSGRDYLAASKLCESAMLEFEALALQGANTDAVRAKLHVHTDMLLDAMASQTALMLSTLGERQTGVKEQPRDDRVWAPLSIAPPQHEIDFRLRDGTVVRGTAQEYRVPGGGGGKEVSYYRLDGTRIPAQDIGGWCAVAEGS